MHGKRLLTGRKPHKRTTMDYLCWKGVQPLGMCGLATWADERESSLIISE